MRLKKMCSFQLAAALLLFCVPSFLQAFEWPLKKAEIVATFGENRHGDFLKGIELIGSEDGVEPVEGGEIIFSSSYRTNLPHRLNAGLGNMAVLQHERGIRSVYGHLDEPVEGDKIFAERGVSFGRVGSSGVVEGRFLYLQVIDSEVARFVNPLLSLPTFRDVSKPVIEGIELDNGKRSILLSEGVRIPRGNYSVKVTTWDSSSALASFRPMAPYSIKLYVNGEERRGLSFESIAVENGRTVPAGRTGMTFNRVYADKWKIVPGEITLQPGEILLELVVSDFSGNETVRDTRFAVLVE